MATSFSAFFTALCATIYVVSVVGVCLFGFDWAIVGLMDLPAVVATGLYAGTGVAIAALAVWFGRIAWRAEQMLGAALAPHETGPDADERKLT